MNIKQPHQKKKLMKVLGLIRYGMPLVALIALIFIIVQQRAKDKSVQEKVDLALARGDTAILIDCIPIIVDKNKVKFHLKVAEMGETFLTDTLGWERAGIKEWVQGLLDLEEKGSCKFTTNVPVDTLKPAKTFALKVLVDPNGLLLLQTDTLQFSHFKPTKDGVTFQESTYPRNYREVKVTFNDELKITSIKGASKTARRQIIAIYENFAFMFNRYYTFRTK